MYRSLQVKHFRCLQDLALEDLAPVNVIVGRNNVGKTSLLEAIFLHAGRTIPQLASVVQVGRGLSTTYSADGSAPWDLLFHDLDTTQPIEILGVDAGGDLQALTINTLSDLVVESEPGEISTGEMKAVGLSFSVRNGGEDNKYDLLLREDGRARQETRAPSIPCVLVFGREHGGVGADDVDRFSKLVIERRDKPIVEAIRRVEPRIRDLSVNKYMGNTTIWADIDLPKLLPMQVLGDGVRRALSLMTSIAVSKGGIVLIDEVEAGFHHSTHAGVWRAIFDFALELDVQVFATTHSHECLVAACHAASELSADMLRVHRLDRSGDSIEAVTYDKEALDGALAADLEVR